MPLREATASFELDADYNTAPFQVVDLDTLCVQLNWESADAADGEAEIQGSADGQNWNVIKSDDNLLTLDTATDTQIWELLNVTTRYIRLAYRANSNTAGSANMLITGNERL